MNNALRRTEFSHHINALEYSVFCADSLSTHSPFPFWDVNFFFEKLLETRHNYSLTNLYTYLALMYLRGAVLF